MREGKSPSRFEIASANFSVVGYGALANHGTRLALTRRTTWLPGSSVAVPFKVLPSTVKHQRDLSRGDSNSDRQQARDGSYANVISPMGTRLPFTILSAASMTVPGLSPFRTS